MQQMALRFSGALEQVWTRTQAHLPSWRRHDWRATKLQWHMLLLQARAARLPGWRIAPLLRRRVAPLLRWRIAPVRRWRIGRMPASWRVPDWRAQLRAAGVAAIVGITAGAFALAALVPGPPPESAPSDFAAIADNGRDGLVAPACSTPSSACAASTAPAPAMSTPSPGSRDVTAIPGPREVAAPEPQEIVAVSEPELPVKPPQIRARPVTDKERPARARPAQRRYRPPPTLDQALGRAVRQAARDFDRLFR
jgi:hypothetical protein